MWPFRRTEGRKKSHRQRGPGVSGQERLARQKARALDELRKLDKQEWIDVLLADVRGKQKQTDPIKQLSQQLRELRDLGLIDDPKSAGADGWKRDLAEALKSIAPALVPLVGQAAQQMHQATEPALGGPSSQPEQPPVVAEVTAVVSNESQLLIRILSGKTPAEGAELFLSRASVDRGIESLVMRIRQTPDDQLPDLFVSLARANPALAGFVDWLLRSWPWTMQVVTIIREAGGASAATGI